MRRLGRLLASLAFMTACLLAAAALCLFAAEQSGFLRGELESRLARMLGERGAQLEIDAAHLAWFRPGIELEGVRLGPQDADGWGPLVADRVWIDFDLDLRALRARVARAEVRGGRARLGHPFWSLGKGTAPRPTWILDDANWPTISLRDIDLDWQDESLGRIPLGSFDAWLSPRGDEPRTLRGFWRPAVASGPKPLTWRAEVEPNGGPLRLRAALRDAALTLESLPHGPLQQWLRDAAPHGIVSIDVAGDLERAADWSALRPTGRALVRLSAGHVQVPSTGATLDVSALTLEARCAGRAWSLVSSATGRFGAAYVECSARASAPASGAADGPAAEIALRVRDLPLAQETLAATGLESALLRIWEGVQPGGLADLACDVRVPRASGSGPGAASRPEVLVELLAREEATLEYRGLLHPVNATRRGFPLSAAGVRGTVLVLHTPDRERLVRVGLVDLHARHAYGDDQPALEARARGLFVSPVRAPHSVPRAGSPPPRPEVALEIGVEHVVADQDLRRALEGLPGTDWIWPTLEPSRGRGSGTFRMRLLESDERPVAHVTGRFEDLDLTWKTLPVPYRAAELDLDLVVDSGLGIHAQATGNLRTAEAVRLTAGLGTDPELMQQGASVRDALSSYLDLELDDMSLRGDDIDVLTASLPGLETALAASSPSGKMDGRVRVVQPLPGGALELDFEGVPRQVECVPRAFPVRARGIEGRVLVEALLPNGLGGSAAGGVTRAVTTRLAPIVGDWSAGARVAVLGRIEPDGSSRQEIYGARVRTDDKNLVAAIAGIASQGRSSRADFSALHLDGRVDCSGIVTTGPAALPIQTTFRAQMRGNSLSFEGDAGPRLGGLVGPVEIGPDGFYCARLDGVLGRTPIRLEDLLVAGREDGGYRVETRVRAESLPLDEEHLAWMLDRNALQALVLKFGWRGAVDLVDTRVSVEGRSTGELRVEFAGRLLFSDVFLLVGLPVRVSSAFADVRSFVYENGRVRAWAELSDLFGSIANRPLDDARATVSYLTPRVNLLDLDGQFVGGRIRGLQSFSALTGPAFSFDLERPFRFELGVHLKGGQVGQLLEGLFESTVEPHGELDANVRLFGNFENLVDLRGSGDVSLARARLWSLPVVRLILSALGAEETAVFDEIFARFQLESGRIQMSDIRVHSPLLNLIGFGTLDLDGTLDYELQVRYSLVDKLGPLTRLLYWVQNNLISISVRGDMARPQVIFRGFLGLFRKGGTKRRDLPLPGYSPLPERF